MVDFNTFTKITYLDKFIAAKGFEKLAKVQ